ncbi:CLUMA_CG009747, isoform A [Clunio marinus]|uniref:CLUMA_CG009747, isoform A n=1 Tax=Clunio marinus TaxID=568069 RepID=A0A1J1I7T9_9DIPT|nr:CLUMA_CG009747, isoform A [Clunio marinus]
MRFALELRKIEPEKKPVRPNNINRRLLGFGCLSLAKDQQYFQRYSLLSHLYSSRKSFKT